MCVCHIDKRYYILLSIRIKELFNIIVEYPDSKPAIEDLKVLKSFIQTCIVHLCLFRYVWAKWNWK